MSEYKLLRSIQGYKVSPVVKFDSFGFKDGLLSFFLKGVIVATWDGVVLKT